MHESPDTTASTRRPPCIELYGLDIETDTTVDGLDPSVAPIVAVALATERGTRVFTGIEAQILTDLDAAIAALEPGVIVTWNGAAFDLPFLAQRAGAIGVPLGLQLATDPRLARASTALAGHDGPYRARWHGHTHLDGFRVFRSDVAAALHISCGLKSIARFIGLTPVEVDRSDISSLSPDELERYVASDAELTRLIMLRRWPGCAAFVDAPFTEPHHRRLNVSAP